jgi:hypothetical protein
MDRLRMLMLSPETQRRDKRGRWTSGAGTTKGAVTATAGVLPKPRIHTVLNKNG